ncbi:hypothetical protein HPB52_013559 [Rhipicephalus sanguineus]|uniref:Uncharacterized protein n=1 Tax=Rhipicephalus sanguineus TaxID=34632 RepID=A0A9D4PWC4_RHISA|nr:hypothetical protein HPB52_013559 [Rhipicephalus sanguineus]
MVSLARRAEREEDETDGSGEQGEEEEIHRKTQRRPASRKGDSFLLFDHAPDKICKETSPATGSDPLLEAVL